jgi:hypothetical protein
VLAFRGLASWLPEDLSQTFSVARQALRLLPEDEAQSRGVNLILGGEHTFLVPPLPLPDLAQLPPPSALADVPAVALLLSRTRALNPRFQLTAENAANLAAICVRLDGLPLAIELAAALVQFSTRWFSESPTYRRPSSGSTATLRGRRRLLPHRHGDWLRQIAGKNQSTARGIERRLCAARQPELAQEVGDVDADGLLADRQSIGDLAIAQTARNQLQHLLLAFGQPNRRLLEAAVRAQQLARRLRMQVRLAAMNGVDGVRQLLHSNILEQIPVRPSLDRFEHQVCFGIRS